MIASRINLSPYLFTLVLDVLIEHELGSRCMFFENDAVLLGALKEVGDKL